MKKSGKGGKGKKKGDARAEMLVSQKEIKAVPEEKIENEMKVEYAEQQVKENEKVQDVSLKEVEADKTPQEKPMRLQSNESEAIEVTSTGEGEEDEEEEKEKEEEEEGEEDKETNDEEEEKKEEIEQTEDEEEED